MAVACTGFFDGVHLGHRAVIETLVSVAHQRADESLVLTFWPHPKVVLESGDAPMLLCSLEQKKEMLFSLGVDRVEVMPFTREFSSLTALEYLEMIRSRFGVKLLVLGYDSHIGSDMKDPAGIAALCSSIGVESLVVPPVNLDSEAISSTRIRRALIDGDTETADRMLR